MEPKDVRQYFINLRKAKKLGVGKLEQQYGIPPKAVIGIERKNGWCWPDLDLCLRILKAYGVSEAERDQLKEDIDYCITVNVYERY